MRKILLVKPHHIEIPAVVITVTSRTILPFDIFGIMITLVFVQPVFDLLMAAQAFIVGDFIADIMALRTIGNSFQVLMRIRQVAWRQLRCHLSGKESQKKNNI